jgi:hypothetical protein
MYAAFEAHLDALAWELIDSGIVIPDVPELADDDTEEARDELQVLADELSYCLTFTAWLAEEIYHPCKVLQDDFEA